MKAQKFWLYLGCALIVSIIVCPLVAIAGGTISGAVSAPRSKYKKDCVVYIEQVPSEFPPTEGAQVDQKGLVFIPHVLPVVKGTTVEFLNSDDVLHNVFTPDEIAEKFNLGTWPRGEIRTYTIKRVGSVVLLCNVHQEMEAYVIVLQNPYFARTGKDGSYAIESVPPGSYSLKVWNKKYKTLSQQIEVKEGGTTEANFKLKKKK
ncbi:MAG: carboxypeptidase regulatory-like domain-containing protein [Candidatus Brocadiales bacterium]